MPDHATLAGKVVPVPGASRGIGAGTAERVARLKERGIDGSRSGAAA